MNHPKTEWDENVYNTVNSQYKISIDLPKKKLNGENCMKAKGTGWIESTQLRRFLEQSGGILDCVSMGKGTKKPKLSSKWSSGSSPLSSDGSRDGQMGSWTALTVAKNCSIRVRNQL
jgi:hypothetical protein